MNQYHETRRERAYRQDYERYHWRYINEPDKFWRHSYKVWLSRITEPLVVNADNEQDALDYAVDYAEEHGWEGYFLDAEAEADHEPDVIYAGNHGRALAAEDIHVEQID